MANSEDNIKRLEDPTKFVGKLTDEIATSERVLNPWKTRITKYYELYKMFQSKKMYEGLASIFVPEILRAVETVVGNLFKAITQQDPWFEFIGRDPIDEPSARAETELINYQMDENNFKAKLLDSLRQMAVTGLTVRKVLWDFQEVSMIDKRAEIIASTDPLTKEVVKERVIRQESRKQTIKDVWTFEPVDLLTFHISDITTPYNDIQKARWIAEQFKVEKEWVRERIKKGWFAKTNLDDIENEAGNYDSITSTEKFIIQRNNASGFYRPSEKKKIEILERWGQIEAKYVYNSDELKELNLDGDDMVESVIVVAQKKIILKLEPNPFWHGQKPYVGCPYVPQEFEFPGIGVAQIAEKLQEELNDTRNQTMDNKTLILMNMWLKSRGSGISNKDLRVRPLGVITTNDMKGLEALRPPVLTGVGVNIEAVIKEDLRESVGASSNLQGIAQSGVNTATESTILNREALGRLATTADMYGMLILKPMLRMVESLNYQFYDRDKIIKVVGTLGVKFVRRSPSDIVGDKDLVLKLSTDMTDPPSVIRQQSLQFFTILQQMPPPLIQYHWKLLDKIYKMFFPTQSLEDLYTAPQGAEDLLNPSEEMDLMLQGYPVHVKQGDDDKDHIKQHQHDLDMMGLAMPKDTYEMLKSHIMDHELKLQQQGMDQANMRLQQMAQMANGGKSQGGQDPMNTGQAANMSAFTQTQGNTPQSLLRDARAGQ